MLCLVFCFFFFKQKTAYEMRISDWSSDVCSSDLLGGLVERLRKMSKRWRCQRAVIPLQISAVTLTADMGALRDRITGDPFDDPTRQPIDDKREEVEQAIGAFLQSPDEALLGWVD